MKNKKIVGVWILCILIATTGQLNAKVDCLRFVYGTIPTEVAIKPATNSLLASEGRTIINQYKYGTDLIIAGLLTPLPTILFGMWIAGAAYRGQADAAINSYCINRDCSCKSVKTARFVHYWVGR